MDNNTDVSTANLPEGRPGPYLARVVSHLDSSYMGVLEVEVLRPSGGNADEGQLWTVQYVSPFAGFTSVEHTAVDPNDYNNTQKSYGMWMIPPDPGTIVVVFLVDGNAKKGYWFGCIPDDRMNFMMPGIAATQSIVDGVDADASGRVGRAPAAEYNKSVSSSSTAADPEQIKKPNHPFTDVLKSQGLLLDDIRGITTSSARRETPSMVFGISTPGPVDKQNGAKTGAVGKKEHQIPNAFVSRLGGTTFVMDDGDDKYLRRGSPSTTPPDYASVEQGDTDGDVTRPHNELVRIRTRTGHQILLHNSEDLIYIGNARGTTWIELTSNGKIDIFASDSISVHTKNDINFTADRDINLTAGGNLNVSTGGAIKLNPSGNLEVQAANTNIDGGIINLNSGKAVAAPKANRVPQAEPWAGHENLDPANFVPSKTQAASAPSTPAPAAFKQYTTKTDTFLKIKGS
jgi:hypothetical protein